MQKSHSEIRTTKVMGTHNKVVEKSHIVSGTKGHDSLSNINRNELQKTSTTSSSKDVSQSLSHDTTDRNTTDRSYKRQSTERNVINKSDTTNIQHSSSTNKIIKQITEKKLIAGKWVNVTRNVEVVTNTDKSGSPNLKNVVDERTEVDKNKTRNISSSIGSSGQVHLSDDNQMFQNTANATYVVKRRTDNLNQSSNHSVSEHVTKDIGEISSQKIINSGQHLTSSNQNIHTQRHGYVSSDTRSHENIHNSTHSTQSMSHVEKNTSHSTHANAIQTTGQRHITGDHIHRKQIITESPIHHMTSSYHTDDQHHRGTHSSERQVQRSSTGTSSSGSHVEQNISKVSSVHQSHSVNRNQISDSVTKTSMEFQRAMHGGGEAPIISKDQASRSGHHKRTSDLVSDSSSTNAVLHRKGVSSTTEAHHSISSTAAAQRKSITNLNERGEYISNSTHSADRKSISSMHRSGRDHAHVISEQNENTDIRRQQKRDGQSTLVVERQPRVVVRDNLRVGGEFYGQSEARSYGSFSRSNHTEKSERNERVEKVERRVRHGTTSNFVLGDGGTNYKREYTAHVHGTCPATLIESPRTPFKHTRDSREHKFYTAKTNQQKS